MVFKKRDQTEKKTVQSNRKQRRRESNPVYLHFQATTWPLHHSDTHESNYYFCHIKTIFLCHGRCLKLVEPYLTWIEIYIWEKLAEARISKLFRIILGSAGRLDVDNRSN